MLTWIQNTDWMILHFIQHYMRCPFLDFLMPKITMLGNSSLIWLLAAVLLFASKKYRKYGIALMAGILCGNLTCDVILKNIIARPRPCWIENVNLLIHMPKDYSFPSGHTLTAVISAVIITCANHRFGWAAIPLAILISFSRLYLFVHFPSDILTSIVFGIIIGLTAVSVVRRTPKHTADQS